MNSIPNQRVSTNKKMTDKTWYIPMADFVIDLAKSSNDKKLTKDCLKAANGILDDSDFEYVLSTYMEPDEANKLQSKIDASQLNKLRDVDLLTPIKDRYMGEFINAYHNYQVYSLDPEVIFKRNHQIGLKVIGKMQEKLQQILNQRMAEQQQASENGQQASQQEPIDIKKFIDNELSQWKDENVAREQSALEMLNATIDAKRKYIDAYFYWWACEEVYTYRRVSGNDVDFEVIDPTEYYRVDSGNYFVEDDHYGLRRHQLTLQELIDKFYNNMEDGLSEEQMKVLDKMMKLGGSSAAVLTPAIFLEHPSAFPDRKPAHDITFTKKGFKTTVDHYFFKTEVQKGILTYMSSSGVAEMDVDETYVLDTANGDISIEWKWIDQMWEGWVFGEDGARMYIPPRPVMLQRELISNSSICKAPYNGASYIHKSSVKKPIPLRIKDNMALYKIYTLLEERWLSKFKTWITAPESILTDSKEFTSEERLQQAEDDAIYPFNDVNLRENPNAISMFREVATTAVIEYVKVLNEIKRSIKADTWELANMNDARFGGGQQVKGKAVTEYDYNQAVKGTVWSLEMFNSFRERDYMSNLDHSRAAWIDGKQGSYVDTNTGEVVYVDVDGMAHLGANVGLQIANSAKLNAQAEALKNIAFSASQNDDPEVAAEAVTNENISKLKLFIKDATKARRDYQLKLATAKEEAQGRIKQLELEAAREQREFDREKYMAELESDYQIALLDNETKLAIKEAELQVDTNGNGYVDAQEAQNNGTEVQRLKEQATMKLTKRKQELDEIKAGIAHMKAKQAAKNKSTKK